MRRWLDAARARLALLIPGRAEARMDEELSFHVDMETGRIARAHGVSPEEARRRAIARFGGVTQHRETLREGRGLEWIGTLSLDFKLGLRMMVKTPGLTFVGLLGLSVAVAIGAFAFSAVSALTNPTLPFEDGDRVVVIMNVNQHKADEAPETHLHALQAWKSSLDGVELLGMYRIREQNLITPGQDVSSVRVAEMSATGFDVTRVTPLRGRLYTAGDEKPEAPPVIVIGHDLWQSKFNGREDIVGTTIQLGESRPTVIGVMPKGYAFPINDQAWAPIRLSDAAYEAGRAPAVKVFGRLALWASIEDAQRQLTMIQARLAFAYPHDYSGLQPKIESYARSGIFDTPQEATLIRLAQIVVTLLLCVVGINVAVLVYARTASRGGEIAVRTALGASRQRIIVQLFVEALVMSGIAAAIGLFAASRAFEPVQTLVQRSTDSGTIPYWIALRMTPGLAAYVALFAVTFAVIIGVIPAFKATRDRLHQNMQDLASSASISLGRTWTVLLVAQVAVSVAALPMAVAGVTGWVRLALLDRSSPATSGMVMAEPLLDLNRGEELPDSARIFYARQVETIARRLRDEQGYDVGMMSGTPGSESYATIAIDSIPATLPRDSSAGRLRRVSGAGLLRVEADFFSDFNVRLLGGRTFTAGDYVPGAPAVIVNRAFTKMFLAGNSAVGRRLRRVTGSGYGGGYEGSKAPTWLVVGVVEDYPTLLDDTDPRVYVPLRSGEAYPITLAVRGPAAFPAVTTERIREAALSIDPSLRMREIRRFDDILQDEVKAQRLAASGLVAFAMSVVLLAAAGIYSLMSFTIVRRRREIGIRTALGARGGRLIVGILGKSMAQVGIGIAIGTVVLFPVARLAGINEQPPEKLMMQALVIGSMTALVGVIATLGPAWRALSVPPNEALRAE